MSTESGSLPPPQSYKGWSGIRRAFGTPSAVTLLVLGFGSGLPFLLIASMTLSTRLRDVGLDLGSIGLISLASFFSTNGLLLGLALLLFVGLFKFPDQVIGVMAGPFYLDSGYSKADIATVSKLYGVWMGIAGAFLGGIAVAAFGFRRMLFLAAIGVALSNVAFVLMAQYPSQIWAFYAAISADNLFQGFAGVVLVAFMSSLTDRNFTATQYALLVSLANLPGKFVGGVSGFIVEATSYVTFFVLSALTVVPTLLLLAWLWGRIREPVAEPAETAAEPVT